jgi:hypothetical protein
MKDQPIVTGYGISGGIQNMWVIRCCQCSAMFWGDTKR